MSTRLEAFFKIPPLELGLNLDDPAAIYEVVSYSRHQNITRVVWRFKIDIPESEYLYGANYWRDRYLLHAGGGDILQEFEVRPKSTSGTYNPAFDANEKPAMKAGLWDGINLYRHLPIGITIAVARSLLDPKNTVTLIRS